MIAIIIVNWNGGTDTIECLRSLEQLHNDNHVAIVVDNGSTDGSIEAIEAWAHNRTPVRRLKVAPHTSTLPSIALEACQIIILETGENLGFAGANNLGMKLAASVPRVKYLWLLNNDTAVAADSLDQLLKTAREKPWARLIGACLMYHDKPEVVQGVAGFFKLWRGHGGHIGYEMSRDQLPPVEQIEQDMAYVMGASMFLPVSTYRETGPMSEAYFLYFEEIDWACRLGKSKKQTVSLNAIIYHKEGGSIGSTSKGRPSATSLYYLARSTLRFYGRWYKSLYFIAWLQVLRMLAPYVRRGDAEAQRAILLAIGDYILGKQRTGRIVVYGAQQ